MAKHFKYIFVSIQEFLANGGKMEPNRTVYRKPFESFTASYIVNMNKDFRLVFSSLYFGEWVRYDESTGSHIIKNDSYKSLPLSEIVAYVMVPIEIRYDLYHDQNGRPVEMAEERKLELIKETFKKLPHSETRVPYTYHHDYYRAHSPFFKDMSRGEVGQLTKYETDLQRYSVALVQLLDNELDMATNGAAMLSPSDYSQAYEIAKEITNELLEKWELQNKIKA